MSDAHGRWDGACELEQTRVRVDRIRVLGVLGHVDVGPGGLVLSVRDRQIGSLFGLGKWVDRYWARSS